MKAKEGNGEKETVRQPKPESESADQEEIIFDNPKWAAGYKEGYKDGFDAGSARGYSKGYQAGYEAGHKKGYQAGYEAGRQSVCTWGYVVALENQREEGSENND